MQYFSIFTFYFIFLFSCHDSHIQCNNDIVEAQAKIDRIKIIEETLEQKFLDETQLIKDLTKKVNDLDLVAAEKEKQIEALEVFIYYLSYIDLFFQRDIKDLMDSTKVDPDNTTVVIKPEDLVKRAVVVPKGSFFIIFFRHSFFLYSHLN